MRRLVLVLVLAAVLSAAGVVGLVRGPDGPPTALSAATPGATPASYAGLGGGDLESVVASLQARLEQVPGDHPAWAALALAQVEQARVSGDASLYERADRAVARSLELAPQDNAPALAARAAIGAARHDFDGALRDATAALAVNPYDATALAVRIDALTELGRYAEQERAITQSDRRRPGVPTLTRYAYARELRGDLPDAARVLRRGLTSATGTDRAFVLVILADVERRLGRLTAADEHLTRALRQQPGYVPALVSRARWHVARGEIDRAVEVWTDVVGRSPLPEYLTELGELHLLQGDAAAARAQFDVVRATNTLAAASGVNTDLEAALFEADHGDPAAALAAAAAEWDRRRSVHVADAYAWALHRTGQDARALDLARRATRLGTAEARLWVHRGLIEAALGRTSDARRHLRRGLAQDPGFAPWQAERAATALERLGAR